MKISKPRSSSKGRKSRRDSTSSSDSSNSSSSDGSSTSSSRSGSRSSSTDRRQAKKSRRDDRKDKKKLKKALKKEAKRERKEIKARKKALYKQEREQRKVEKHLRKQQKKEQKRNQSAATAPVERVREGDCGVPLDLMNTRARAPETREQYEARQSVIRRVVDPETGRARLIKGDGEILEECVSRERHTEINRQATAGDGAEFQRKTIGWKFD